MSNLNGSIHKLITGLISGTLFALSGFLWNVHGELSAIRVEIDGLNKKSAEILTVLDTIAPRTVK